jgi:hypothetical protein
MKTMWLFIFLSIFLINPLTADAQKEKIVKVEGEAQVRIENNESRDQAKERVEELAKLDAIQKAFGTYVEQVTDIAVEEGKINYSILAGTKIKADWIRNTNIKFTYPEQPGNTKDKIIWIKCSIEGEARPVSSKANLEILALRCPQKECAATDFKNNQNLYLYFKAPVKGYLSVFIDEGEKVRRLLPYENAENQSSEMIMEDTPYIFFEKRKGTMASSDIDELELYTNKSFEYNTLYVLFSEEQYVKPILEMSQTDANNYIYPKSLSSASFQEWLGDCRAASTSFQDKKIKIRISKK